MNKSANDNLMDNIEKPIGRVSMKLHKNVFSKDDTNKYCARVVRNTNTVGNVLQLVADKVPQLDVGTVYSVCDAFEKVITETLEKGNSVECLNLGVFYIASRGSTDGSSSPKVTVGFTPKDLIKSAVKNIVIEQIGYENPCALIKEIEDIDTGETDGSISQNGYVKIRGKKLLIGGDGSGIWFAPIAATRNTIDETGANWKEVLNIAINKPSTLLFAIPKDIAKGKYKIVHKTKCQYKLSFKRKELITTISDIVEIK